MDVSEIVVHSVRGEDKSFNAIELQERKDKKKLGDLMKYHSTPLVMGSLL